MKFTLAAAVVALAIVGSVTNGAVIDTENPMSLEDKLAEIKAELQWRFGPMGDQLKDVMGALGSVATDSAKSLMGQTLQALGGALITSIKDFDLSGIIGKRDLGEWSQLLHRLAEGVHQSLEAVFKKTFDKFGNAITTVVRCRPSELASVQKELKDVAETHEMEVRGVLSDTLNTGIDYVKSLYLKLKEKLGSLKPTPLDQPLAISKRGLWDMASQLKEHIQSIHDKIRPHLDTITAITTDLASALGHHAGNLLDQTKEDTLEKVKSVVSLLSDHLSSAKEKMSDIKEQAGAKVQEILSSFQS
jgi:ElaB/YqjD/DUF883 family membrane-anchored ribosome-binding protein